MDSYSVKFPDECVCILAESFRHLMVVFDNWVYCMTSDHCFRHEDNSVLKI